MKFHLVFMIKAKLKVFAKIILISIPILTFQGCSYQISKWYESDYKIREPIPSEARIRVRFGSGKIDKIFRDSKEFIDNAIVKDIEENILTIEKL